MVVIRMAKYSIIILPFQMGLHLLTLKQHQLVTFYRKDALCLLMLGHIRP